MRKTRYQHYVGMFTFLMNRKYQPWERADILWVSSYKLLFCRELIRKGRKKASLTGVEFIPYKYEDKDYFDRNYGKYSFLFELENIIDYFEKHNG